MAKKTNKTSHILDLLTNGPAPETSAPVPKKVTVVDEGSRNDRLSQEILNNLSEELENDTPEADSHTSGEQPAAPVNAVPHTPVQIPHSSSEQTSPQEEPEPSLEVIEELDIELESLLEKDDEEEYYFVNVMEELLKQQDLEGTMKRFNVCTCPRCNADVRALTLTALPAKYVVIGQNSFSPVLNYYENKLKISMLTALNKACNVVRERPHHKR